MQAVRVIRTFKAKVDDSQAAVTPISIDSDVYPQLLWLLLLLIWGAIRLFQGCYREKMNEALAN